MTLESGFDRVAAEETIRREWMDANRVRVAFPGLPEDLLAELAAVGEANIQAEVDSWQVGGDATQHATATSTVDRGEDSGLPVRQQLPYLTDIERDHYERAELYVKATEYLAALGAPGFGDAPHLLNEARYAARGVIALTQAVDAERSIRIALKQRCETQQALLTQRASRQA